MAALGISCSMWDLAPWPGIEPGPPALGAQSLSPGPPGRSPLFFSFSLFIPSLLLSPPFACFSTFFVYSSQPANLKNHDFRFYGKSFPYGQSKIWSHLLHLDLELSSPWPWSPSLNGGSSFDVMVAFSTGRCWKMKHSLALESFCVSCELSRAKLILCVFPYILFL